MRAPEGAFWARKATRRREMPNPCARCGKAGDPPPAHRIGFGGPDKDRVLSEICAACWKEWEGTEIKVINEYRLSFVEPSHREILKKATLDFLFASKSLNLPE